MTDQPPVPSATVAAAYDRGRPTYPVEAATWLVGSAQDSLTVLELGAGTGKLTEVLVGLGHDVHATEPDEAMLEVLRARLPEVRTSRTSAEEIPLADRSVDVVVVGHALHRFDLERALPEIERVLRPGGHLAAVWNLHDDRVPWVRRLGALLEERHSAEDLGRPLEETGLFGWVEDATFKHRQPIDRESVQDLVRSRSLVAALGEAAMEAKVAEVLAFYDDYGRGMDGMVVPLVAHCFRAQVAEKAAAVAPEQVVLERADDAPMLVTTGSIPRIEVDVASTPHPLRQSVLDDDTAMLLIDFR